MRELHRYLNDEQGGASVLNLVLFYGILGLCGIAIDGGNAYMTKTMMQATADAAAAAAAQELPDENAAKITGVTYVDRNMNPNTHGDMAGVEDIRVGRWDAVAETFREGQEPNDAVMVTLARNDERGNSLPTFLLGLAGFTNWDISVQSVAVATQSGRDCRNGGFFSNDIVYSGSDNTYIDGFCLHGQLGVKVGSNNYFEDGTIVSMIDDQDLIQSQGNTGILDALTELDLNLPLPGRIPGIIAAMRNGDLTAMPSWINQVQAVDEITADTPIVEGTLYIVENVADFGSNRTIRNIAVVAGKEVKTGSNVVLYNVFLATEDKALFGSNNVIGTADFCESGLYNAYVFAMDNVEFGSGTGQILRGLQMASRKEIKLGSQMAAVEGVYGEADLAFDYGSADAFGGCPGVLNSVVTNGAGDNVFVADGVGVGGGSILVR